jgi:hypothetical protein
MLQLPSELTVANSVLVSSATGAGVADVVLIPQKAAGWRYLLHLLHFAASFSLVLLGHSANQYPVSKHHLQTGLLSMKYCIKAEPSSLGYQTLTSPFPWSVRRLALDLICLSLRGRFAFFPDQSVKLI